jgi:uncharacterized protein (DUF924 family)
LIPADAFETILRFWFPADLHDDEARLLRQYEWWFRGAATTAIAERFRSHLDAASRGDLDDWAHSPRSRLALIIVLDQFSRSLHAGVAKAYEQDAKALALALEGIAAGHYAALKTPWEKTFFFLPLGHAEDLRHLQTVVGLSEELARRATPAQRTVLEHSASQARAHRDVIARFGRHPHRNAVLGRQSTLDDLDYLARERPVHMRPLPR